MDVIDSKPATLAEVKQLLVAREKEIKSEGDELFFEQKRALEHSQQFSKLSVIDSKKIIEQIKGLELELNDEQMIKFADLLPETVDDVRAIFAKERFKYSPEDIRKILDVVDQFR
ncbi:MAG: RNA polymerase Rpb4 family protein [Candidatus Altiarchaeota archaeon]